MGASTSRREIEERITSVTCEVTALPQDSFEIAYKIADVVPDSLDQMRLYMALEDEFDGAISEEELALISTFKDVADYIENAKQYTAA